MLKKRAQKPKGDNTNTYNWRKKERWITVNKRNSEVKNKVYERQTPVTVNLKKRFKILEEPIITEKHNDATP